MKSELSDIASSTDLFASVDEAISDNSDFIQSADGPVNDTCRLALQNPGFAVDTGAPHTVSFRYGKTVQGEAIDLTVRLIQAPDTVIAEQAIEDIPASPTDGSIALTAGQIAAITDYSALLLEFVANAPIAAGGGEVTAGAAALLVESNSGTDSSGTSSTTYTAQGGPNSCLIAGLAVQDNANPPLITPANTTMTFGGTPMTYIGGVASTDAFGCAVHLFRLIDPPTTPETFSWAMDNDARAKIVGARELLGVDPTNPTGAPVVDTAASVAITPANNGSWIVSLMAARGDATPVTSTADTTELFEQATGTGGFSDVTAVMGEHDVGEATALTMGSADVVTSPACIAVEINPA